MYQDYPGNFDTSSRGSSGSPAHAESYSSGGGGQQVGAGPGCTWRRGWTPAFLSPPLPLLLSLPFLGLVRKYLRATIVSSEFSSPAHTSFHPLYPRQHFFFLTGAASGLKEPTNPVLHTTSYPDKLLELQVPFPEACASLLSQEFISIPLSLRGGPPPLPKFFTHVPLPISRELIPEKKPSPSFPTPTPHLLPPLVLVNFGKRLGTRKLVGLLQVIQSEGENCHSGSQVRRSGRRRSALIGSGCVRLCTLRPSTSC